jgi:hypothetical protein
MKIKAGFSEKNGTRFAIAQLDISMVDVPGRAIDAITRLKKTFPDTNIILMARDKKGSPIFYGRPDIVNGLGDAALADVEWSDYDLDLPASE